MSNQKNWQSSGFSAGASGAKNSGYQPSASYQQKSTMDAAYQRGVASTYSQPKPPVNSGKK